MKLRNKKTGDVCELNEFCLYDDKGFAKRPFLKTLAELNEEWEDYEEPKEYWHINTIGGVGLHTRTNGMTDSENSYIEDRQLEIGNYFETKEQAEKAVERLRAWKRLKDKGFRFEYVEKYENLCGNGFEIPIKATMPPEAYTDVEVSKDLDLLFGGEE